MTELSNDHLGERLSRLWFRQDQLWSELSRSTATCCVYRRSPIAMGLRCHQSRNMARRMIDFPSTMVRELSRLGLMGLIQLTTLRRFGLSIRFLSCRDQPKAAAAPKTGRGAGTDVGAELSGMAIA